MKKISLIFVVIFSFSVVFLSGCTHEMVSLYIYKMPDKLVYEIGESLDVSGLDLRNIKTDSALSRISNKNASFSGFNSTISGKKEIIVSYGKFTTSFSVYVANKVVNNNEELKTTLETIEDDDIVLLKQGEYSFNQPIEINNSNIIIGGEGKDKTKINSFAIIGGNLTDNNIQFTNSSDNISFIGISFNMNNSLENNQVKFENNNYNYSFGAINCGEVKGLNVISCGFTGFSYGIKVNNLENSVISANSFNKLFVGAIEVNNNTKNTTISKNIINSIGNSVVFLNNNDEQEFLFGIKLSIDTEENCGVSVYKNSISKIAVKNLNLVYLNKKSEGDFASLNYLNNSGAIIIRSSAKNNLQTNGISIFYNSIGASLNNILYNTTESDRVNSSSIMYMAF